MPETRLQSSSIYQINTRVWLHERALFVGRPATFDDVPDEFLDAVKSLGFDWIWWLGVWQTGPKGRAISRAIPELRPEFQSQLSDLSDDDITGSPFAIASYRVHDDYGGDATLARLRTRMAERGLKLMLDFVPNHTGPDCPWIAEHPEWYIHGREDDLVRRSHDYERVDTDQGPRILAHGRDPYFPGWTDTFQVNIRHEGLRRALTETLVAIAGQCDGVRCDMAMLLLPDVFLRTWGDLSRPADGSAPVDAPFWAEVIPVVKAANPDFSFLAEAYWDREWDLQVEGFDATYDKRLYDRLHDHDAVGVGLHLLAGPGFQKRSLRFLENHDEPRAASAFSPEVLRAAAVVTYLVPGPHLFYEGQLEGRRVRPSVHLRRRPVEPIVTDLFAFYRRLLEVARRPERLDGRWQILPCLATWTGDATWERFLAFAWERDGRRLLVAVNFGGTEGECFVTLPWTDLAGRTIRLADLLGDAVYDREGDDLNARGLFLDMPAWAFHVFTVSDAT